MHFSQKTFKALEYDTVKEMLAECAPTSGARRRALSLMPSDDFETVIRRQEKTDDAKKLLSSKGFPHFTDAEGVSDSAERAMKGSCLSTRELTDIASLLFCARMMLDYIHTEKPYQTSLDAVFERLVPNRVLEDRIRRTIISEDVIADEASPELAEIRRKIKIENNRIKDILQGYMGGARLKYLQENIVTVRDGRYVIPVKAEYRSEVKGLLHDTSSSGSTLFIEPIAIVEANNQLKILENKERAEIERILFELSSMCGDFANQIISDYETMTELAFYFTCASFSVNLRANRPKISETPCISLRRARHPLIRGNVVPIDVSLGKDFDTMIITGPNTGGKTVTLKTLGLFVLMAQSGLQIPADEDSEIGIFQNVLVDIGDEQSIEQSLSTFSAHMKNIVSILDGVEPATLALFDELGAGTDPIEGAALAVAIIEKVRSSGAFCAVTTHYAELKAYALDTDGIQNASCEFDIETLAPTYRLIVGAPGKSNAFAISRKLGLADDIVSRADELISGENKNFESVISKLEATRISMEKSRDEAEKLRCELESIKKNEEKKLQERTEKSQKEIENSRQKAKALYDSARATSDYVLKELDKLKKAQQKQDFAKAFEAAKNDIRNRIRDGLDLYDSTEPSEVSLDDDYVLPRPLKVGDKVYVVGLGQRGTVTAISDKNSTVSVSAGIIRAKVELDKIRLIEDSEENRTPNKAKKATNSHKATLKSNVVRDFHPEIDVRGKYADDAWFAVDKYLDDAVLSGVLEVRIIHGKGTGVLRKTLQEYLKTDSRVRSYRNGVFGEGEMGVTVVTLK